jgi:hypothetical protein
MLRRLPPPAAPVAAPPARAMPDTGALRARVQARVAEAAGPGLCALAAGFAERRVCAIAMVGLPPAQAVLRLADALPPRPPDDAAMARPADGLGLAGAGRSAGLILRRETTPGPLPLPFHPAPRAAPGP